MTIVPSLVNRSKLLTNSRYPFNPARQEVLATGLWQNIGLASIARVSLVFFVSYPFTDDDSYNYYR